MFPAGVSVPEILDMYALLSASEAAGYAGVSIAAIGNWHSRGYHNPVTGQREYLPVATDEHGRQIRDAHGRPKYRLLHVARVEAATRKRARRAA